MAASVTDHASLARRIGLPQAVRLPATTQPTPSAQASNSSDATSSSISSLFSDDEDEDVLTSGSVDSSAKSEDESNCPPRKPTTQPEAAISPPPVPQNTEAPALKQIERTRSIKSQVKGKKSKTALKPTPSQGPSSRPSVTLSSQAQSKYWATSGTPGWARGQQSSEGSEKAPVPKPVKNNKKVSVQKFKLSSAGASTDAAQTAVESTAHSVSAQPPSSSAQAGATLSTANTQISQSTAPKSIDFDTIATSTGTSTLTVSPPLTTSTLQSPLSSLVSISDASQLNDSATVPAPPTHITTPVVPKVHPRSGLPLPSVLPPGDYQPGSAYSPKFTTNGSFSPNISVCSAPEGFVAPPPPSLLLPPQQQFKNYSVSEFIQLAQHQQKSTLFPTQAAPLNCVSPAWLSKTTSNWSTMPKETQTQAPLPQLQVDFRPTQTHPPQAQPNSYQIQQGPRAQQSSPWTSMTPMPPPLRRAASEQITPRYALSRVQPSYSAYSSVSQGQLAATRQLRTPQGPLSDQASPSVRVPQVVESVPRIVAVNSLPRSNSTLATQAGVYQPTNNSQSFSADAWRANSDIQSLPLVRAQSYHGCPVGQSSRAPQTSAAAASRLNTASEVSSRLSQVRTAPTTLPTHKRRMEWSDDEVQEIPPPHGAKRFRGQ